LPVDIIIGLTSRQITKAAKTAPKAEAPKPLVEKGAKPPADNPAPKVVRHKPEIAARADKPELPTPEPVKKVEPKPPRRSLPPRPPDRSRPTPRQPEPKIDPIAEAIKKEEKKKPDPKPGKRSRDAEDPEPPKGNSPVQRQPDRRPARQARGAAPVGHRRDAEQQARARSGHRECRDLVAERNGCATRPVARLLETFRCGVAEARDLVVPVRIQFNKDGSLSDRSTVMNHAAIRHSRPGRERGARVRRCAPYSFMPPLKYEAWRDVIVDSITRYVPRLARTSA